MVALPAAEQGAPLQPFNDNTIELLERAERAIDQSIELPELTRNLLAEARQLQLRGDQKDRFSWHRMQGLAADWLPQPRIPHPYPDKRFVVMHPRQEPCAEFRQHGFGAGGQQ